MDSAGSHSERFVEQLVSEEDLSQIPGMELGITTPMSPLASPEPSTLPAPDGTAQTQPAEGGSVSVFRIDQDRLIALQDLTWRRVRLLLWVLVVGVALGLLLLIPAVHAPLPVLPGHLPKGVTHPQTAQRPFWAALLFVIGVGGPLLTQKHQTEFYLERMQPDWLPDTRSRRWYQLSVGLVVGVGFTVAFGLVFGLLGEEFGSSFQMIGGLAGLLVGLTAALIFGRFFGWLAGVAPHIAPAEIFVWRWESLWKGLSLVSFFTSLPLGLALGLLAGLAFGLTSGLTVVLLCTLGGTLGTGLFSCWSTDMLDTAKLFRPNQGIWRSARNGLLAGLVFGLIGAALGMLGSVVAGIQDGSLLFGLVAGLTAAVACGLAFLLYSWMDRGGEACIQHAFLRLLLRRTGCVPKGYVAFLDYAADCILLRKVGGGYSFAHRLLLEYFASLETTPPSA